MQNVCVDLKRRICFHEEKVLNKSIRELKIEDAKLAKAEFREILESWEFPKPDVSFCTEWFVVACRLEKLEIRNSNPR